MNKKILIASASTALLLFGIVLVVSSSSDISKMYETRGTDYVLNFNNQEIIKNYK